MSDIDFSQLEKFSKNWQEGTKQFDDFLRKFLTEMANRLLAKVKPRTPVDTGALRAAWQIGEIRGSGRNIEIEILNFMDYASFVELGHRTIAGTWVEGRFMLTISIDEIYREMPARFQQQFRVWLTERGMA